MERRAEPTGQAPQPQPISGETVRGMSVYTKMPSLLEPIQHSSIQVHQSEQCPSRPFSCEYCKDFDSNYEDITTNHWPKCGHYPVRCTNRCGKSIKRQHLKDHISNGCPLTVVDCEFGHVGCEMKLPRRDMPAHLIENVVKHMIFLTCSKL